MASKRELLNTRKNELLARGYHAKLVDLALEWALGSANGMVDYYLIESDEPGEREKLLVQILPRYLKDCESWMQAVGEPPVKPQ